MTSFARAVLDTAGTAGQLPAPLLPAARGPLSTYVLGRLSGGRPMPPTDSPRSTVDAICDGDLQLALYLCYELHYGGFEGVPDDLEWEPELLRLRAALERRFEATLRALVPVAPVVALRELVPVLGDLVGGPAMSEHVRDHATVAQVREFVVHRSAYQLKEADPHTWAIPRLRGVAKQLLVRIQAGEYGVEDEAHVMHAELFATAMASLGLDGRPNSYLEALPAVSLAVSNLATMFGLHRRLRGASIGHLALSEMTSVAAMERYVAGLHRLALPAPVRRFFEVHVLADAEHALVMGDLLDSLVESEPQLHRDVAFGIGASLVVEAAFASHVLGAWGRDEPSLRVPIGG